ncbi:MAG: Valyl-tRNA synthetase (EC 6.1.1.9) [Olavius algarvensis Delta 4 endosymbiont]|nr:MAG: Valyl-tRNA synthetase (EC 6.1.1.9) [Olavius algarvensis Delta 4 endosymbiont]
MCADMLEKGYEPGNVEKKWYAVWEQEQLFAAADTSTRPSYSIVIPPPNVTGVLHMGHALNNTMQDVLCRYRRLKGDNVLWMPGTDHAGIATQNVVERQLAAEGLTRHEVGREKFIEKVWDWKHKSGNAIINQLKRLGASCDWKRERFTMDEGLSAAVRKVFVQLYEEGLIYQGDYIINWCHRCHTALADLEVEHEERDGHLYHIRYPYADGDGYIVVATTRPETMLGDTAVAVHPEDERYADLPAGQVTLPLLNKNIPIIRDSYVDMSFGTGGLKITPAHDPNDFELGRKHDLPAVKVIDDNGFMTAEAGQFEGLDRVACRDAVIKALEAEGLLEKIDPYQHSVGHCYRCKEIVEPNLSRQWFVKAKPLADKAIAAVKTGQTRIIPQTWEKTYYDWLENIRDWCISRQIWWGHQIPAWTCAACGRMVVAVQAPESCPDCRSTDMVQDTDVLDTWFSSALWPFSTMGWPKETDLLKTFYPTSVLVTGFDILFFWVARMMMMGIHFMGTIPFKDVYVHALVRDEKGKKMSKSKGNVIDPLTVIESYGTDAFRFTLAAFAVQGRDVKMSEKRVEGYRHFVNKLWNAARFSLMHIQTAGGEIDRGKLSLADRWILSRLSRLSRKVAVALDDYKFNEAAGALYKFIWHEFCDWYLEASKPALYGEDEEKKQNTLNVLYRVLKDTIVILHPLMPFVTEEIWHKLPGTEGSVMQAAYPAGDTAGVTRDDQAEIDMNLVMGIITGIRNVRGEMNITPSMELAVQVQTPEDAQRETLATYTDLICNLARATSLDISVPADKPKSSAAVIVEGATVLVNLEGIIDFAREAARLDKEIAKIAKELQGVSKKLSNEGFLGKAPADVIEKVRAKHQMLTEKQEKLQASKERLQGMV